MTKHCLSHTSSLQKQAGERDNRVSEVKDPGFLSSADVDFQHNLRLKAKPVVM